MDRSYRRTPRVPYRSPATSRRRAAADFTKAANPKRPMPPRRTAARFKHIAFVASDTPAAQKARRLLVRRYGDALPETADVVVALGGDGLMLSTLQRFMNSGKPIYGMH